MAMSVSLLFTQIRDYIHSLYFCLKAFHLKDAFKTPVNISYNVKIGNIHRGAIELQRPITHNQVYIGHQGFSAIAEQPGLINIEEGGRLVIQGSARFAQGVRLWIDRGATITIGDNFYCNKNCLFRAFDNISIGKDVLLGWNVEMNTSDGHHLVIENNSKPNHGPIKVSDHVWVASHVGFAKNSSVPSDTVIAQRSLVTTTFDKSKILIAGVPAKEIREDIQWTL